MASTEINTTSYSAIAADYAAAVAGITGLSQQYYDAAYEILILSVFDPELDLLQPFYNAYLASTGVYENVPISAVSAVGELQRHVLSRGETAAGARYADIDAWLTAKSLTVPQEFADVSALAGFPIAAGNIS